MIASMTDHRYGPGVAPLLCSMMKLIIDCARCSAEASCDDCYQADAVKTLATCSGRLEWFRVLCEELENQWAWLHDLSVRPEKSNFVERDEVRRYAYRRCICALEGIVRCKARCSEIR